MSKRVWVVPGHVLDRPVDGVSDDVWAARIAGSIDQVALRIIALHGEDAIEAGRRAALALTELAHPYLLALHDVIVLRDAVVVASDLCSGGSLDRMLRARERLSPGETASVVGPIASALAYVHERGLVHGDVSPRRVLFSVTGVPVLSGLGVARIAGTDAPNPSTPAYIDPSVACGVFPSPSSDVFMLGAVAFHALTGAPLWHGDAREAMSAAIAAPLDRSLDRVAERLAQAGVPSELAVVICAALALDVHLRPTAAQLASALAAIATSLPPMVTPAAAPIATELPMAPVPLPSPPPPSVPPPPVLSPLPPAIEPNLAGWAFEAPSPPPPITEPAPPPVPEPVRPIEATPRWGAPIVVEPFRPAEPPEPEPFEPAPLEPTPFEPAPFEPAPFEPAPFEPAPIEPAPFEPTPFEPTPFEPDEVSTRRGQARHSARRARIHPPRRVRSPWLFVAIAAVVLGAGATVWAVTSDGGSSNMSATSPTITPSSTLPTGSGLPFDPASGNLTPTSAPTGGVIDAAAAAQILATLDSVRQRAFASRAPILLTGVWGSERLLKDDQALLEYLVPEGCGLQGARTIYSNVQVLDLTPVSLVILARTSVTSAVLVCHGKITGQSPESPSLKNRITLVKRGTGWLISEIAALSAPSPPSTTG